MDFDWSAWKRAELLRNEKRAAQTKERLERALLEAIRLGKRILEVDPDVKSIVLFGSVARKEPVSDHFDIDIAVRGASRFALLEAAAISDEYSVDLVQLEYASERMRENIEREGIPLYG
jgi:predicted nucleotidyltransferase